MKTNPSRLLCATDFTPRSEAATLVAAKLAARWRRPLYLAHAAPVAAGEGIQAVQRRLKVEALRLRETGAEVEPVFLREFPAGDALAHWIGREQPALTVLAAAGKSPVDRWRFGSVSERVAQSSEAPTLVLRRAAPFERWLAGGTALRILAAVDLNATSDAVLRWVRELRRLGPCDLVVCHASVDLRASSPREQARLERMLKKKTRDILGDEEPFRTVARPAPDGAAAALIAEANEGEAELIAIGAHQREGLSRLMHGSLSRAVLREAETNVACVPIAAEFDPRDERIPEFRRVLVATDFSPLGNAAIPQACAACGIGGLVRIVHVAKPPRRRALPGGLQAGLVAKLRRLVPDEMGARGQPPETGIIAAPDPAAAICAEAERFGADLVCMASHGGGASRDVFGSVAEAVLKRIRRPLLVVRRPDE